jgi:hypothetical protein
MATNKKRVQGYVSDTAYQYLEDYRVTNELRSQSEALDHLLNSLVGGNPSSNLPSELLSELKGELLSELLSELKGELLSELKGELLSELKGELLSELKGELLSELDSRLKAFEEKCSILEEDRDNLLIRLGNIQDEHLKDLEGGTASAKKRIEELENRNCELEKELIKTEKEVTYLEQKLSPSGQPLPDPEIKELTEEDIEQQQKQKAMSAVLSYLESVKNPCLARFLASNDPDGLGKEHIKAILKAYFPTNQVTFEPLVKWALGNCYDCYAIVEKLESGYQFWTGRKWDRSWKNAQLFHEEAKAKASLKKCQQRQLLSDIRYNSLSQFLKMGIISL